MKAYDQRRVLKQHRVIPKKEMKMPEKNIPVVIRPGLVVYTDSIDKIEMVRAKFKDKY